MNIYPAIDLIGGAVVRLHKGDFDQLTTYGDDPVSVAQSYSDAGATWLHLVDLDGAKNPENRQIDLISKIISSTGLEVQTGGGIRSFADVQALVDAGATFAFANFLRRGPPHRYAAPAANPQATMAIHT